MYECDVWNFPDFFSARRFNGEWLERQEFYNQALSRHRLVLGGSLRGLENIQTPDDLYRCHSETKGAALWGEKSPVYSARLARLAEQYPRGSFILIWRDPVEIYRSIRQAGKKSPFFRRPAMLERLIYRQECMVREAGQLQGGGVRIHHVHYDALVDQTAEVCRGVCQFLQVDYEPKMACLNQADFSAVYPAPQHDFLRRGVIERQPLSNELVKPAEAQKLLRFRKRWERLAGRPMAAKPVPASTREPAAAEILFHRAVGGALHTADELKRAAFEFLPLPWLRTYRQFRHWLRAREAAPRPLSLGGEFRQHGITIVAGFLFLMLAALVDFATGPEISCGPIYLIPCGLLALVVGRKWGTLAALGCAVSVTLLRDGVMHHFHGWLSAAVAWNMVMRFVLFEVFVLLLDRIRRDFNPPAGSRNGSPHR